jgi:hypothetical protein
MRRFVIIVFVFCAAALAVLFALRYRGDNPSAALIRARMVSLSGGNKAAQVSDETMDTETETALISFIPLQNDETVLQTLSADFNGDGYEDQINAVRQGNRQNIILLTGIYTPRQNTYERREEIDTGITDAESFSYTCMDVTGEHQNALVYSGISATGDSVMQIFLGQGTQDNFRLIPIGNFRANGSIFIQQIDRYDSYETSQAAGISFPVWVYSTDAVASNSLDQLQTVYEWNPGSRRYVQSRQTRIAGQRMTGTELARIQDGTLKTFTAYLDGLWYQTSGSGQENQYIFFDYDAREIIFVYEDMQEVYSWGTSVLRRNGMYLTTVNASITNLSRQFDVSLTGNDEITVRVQDDVRLKISENTQWDGTYKKFPQTRGAPVLRNEASSEMVVTALSAKDNWNTSDGIQIQFSGKRYSVQTTTGADSGRLSVVTVAGNPVIQFRSETASPFFKTAYVISKNTSSEGTDFFLMEPVSLLPSGFEKTGQPSVRLE